MPQETREPRPAGLLLPAFRSWLLGEFSLLLSPLDLLGFFAMLSGIVGRRETGKTTLTMFLARHDPMVPRMVFDPRNGIAARGSSIKVFTADDLIDQAFPAMAAGEVAEVIYTPRENNLSESFLVFSTLAQHYIEQNPRRFVVVIDECALVKDDLESLDHPLQAAMRWSRRDRVHFFLTCHQPKNIPTNTRAISDYLIFFRATQEHDLTVIRERCSAQFAADVSQLQPYHFLIWNDQTAAVMPSRVKPADWKVSLDAPIVVAPKPRNLDVGNLWL